MGLKLFTSEVQRLKKMDSQKPTEVRNKNLIGFLPGFDRKIITEPLASAAACKALWVMAFLPQSQRDRSGGKLAAPLTIHYLEPVL